MIHTAEYHLKRSYISSTAESVKRVGCSPRKQRLRIQRRARKVDRMTW